MGALDFLPALIVAAGLYVGWLLSVVAREEMKKGKRWLIMLQHSLFVIAAFVFLFSTKGQVWHVVIGTTALAAYVAFDKFRHPYLAYFLFGIAYSVISGSQLFLIFASVLFLFGLPTGSLVSPYIPSLIFLLTSLGLNYL